MTNMEKIDTTNFLTLREVCDIIALVETTGRLVNKEQEYKIIADKLKKSIGM